MDVANMPANASDVADYLADQLAAAHKSIAVHKSVMNQLAAHNTQLQARVAELEAKLERGQNE